MPFKSLRFANFLLLLATGYACAATPDSTTSLHPYIGGELTSASDPYLYSPVQGSLNIGVYGQENSLGLMFSVQDLYREDKETIRIYGSTSSPRDTTETSMVQVRLAVIGLDFRHYFLPIGDPRHSPFVSATASKLVSLGVERTSSKIPEPEIGGYILGIGIGEETKIGALTLSGKIGGRYQSLTYETDYTSLFLNSYNSSYSSSSSRVTSKMTHTFLTSCLEFSLGLAYRF